MAYLMHCIYCHGQIVDQEWHPLCRIAHLENTLHELRHFVEHPGDGTLIARLNRLSEIIKREQWRSKESFEREQQEQQEISVVKQLRESARASAVLEFIAEWERENPEHLFVHHV